jgi:hypothetical protein
VLIVATTLSACAASTDGPPDGTSTEAENPLATVAATGPSRSCLQISQIDSTEGISDRAIIFRMRGGDLYRNELNANCPGARRDMAFSYSTTIGQICRGEILTFFDPPVRAQYGSCALGDFVPIPKDARAMMKEEPKG